jgi:hypothetical protein
MRSASPAVADKAEQDPADPLAALLCQAVRDTADGPVRAWLEALLERGEAASGRGAGRAVVRADDQKVKERPT